MSWDWWTKICKGFTSWLTGDFGSEGHADTEDNAYTHYFPNDWPKPESFVDPYTDLKSLLLDIVDFDPSLNPETYRDLPNAQASAYVWRNRAIMVAVNEAVRLGLKAGYVVHDPIEDMLHTVDESVPCVDTPYDNVSFPKWDPRWGVVAIIELPTGQISWHMDSGNLEYDGHTNEDKISRVKEFAEGVQ